MSINFCQKCLPVTNRKRKEDRRHITYYYSYHYAKYFGITGSILICIGLFLWFTVKENVQLIVTLTVTLLGVLLFLIASILFFKSVYHTFMEQRNDINNNNINNNNNEKTIKNSNINV